MISLNQWLNLFNKKTIGYEDFLKKGIVRSTRDVKLSDVERENKDVRNLYNIYVNRFSFLEKFYRNNLDPNVDFNFSGLKLEINNSKYPRFKRLSRNLFYKEILKDTQTSQGNLQTFLNVLLNFFNHFIIDYKLLTPSVLSLLEKGLFSSVMSGVYFKASLFNPFLCYSAYKKYGGGSVVFSPTLGWGTYMLGICQAEEVKEYIGVDVIPKVCKEVSKIGHKMFPDKKIKIYCQGSETLKLKKDFVDFIFFSPPYYQLEIYPGKEQSVKKFNSYEKWLDGYWRKTMKLCFEVLKKNGIMIYIISNYQEKGSILELEKDMVKITKEFFTIKKKVYLKSADIGFTSHRTYKETMFIFTPNRF